MLPFYVFALLGNVLSLILVVCSIPTVIAIGMIVSGGLVGKDRTWWGNAWKTFVSGISSGAVIAAFTVAFASCSSGLGRWA